MSFHLINNTVATDAYAFNSNLASLLASVNGDVSVAFWMKFPKDNGVRLYYQAWGFDAGAGSVENSFVEIYCVDNVVDSNYGDMTARAQDAGVDSAYATQSLADQDWHLVVINFQAGGIGKNYYNIQLSMDGGTLQTATGAAIAANVALNRINIGDWFFSNGTSRGTSFIPQETLYSFMAHKSGVYSQQNISDMYGSGPSAGDGVDPYDIDNGNIICYTRFKNNFKSIIGPDWSINGNDYEFSSDKPSILEHRFNTKFFKQSNRKVYQEFY